MGTANNGKLSSPPNMDRIKYFAPTVNDGSNTPGNAETIPSEIETGIAITRAMAKIINTTTTGIINSPNWLQYKIPGYCVQDARGQIRFRLWRPGTR